MRPARSCGLAGERFAGLEQRLQAAHDVRPAALHLRCRLRAEALVDSGELAVAPVLRLDLPRHAPGLLGRELRVVEELPRHGEPPRRIRLEHLALYDQLLAV